MDGWNDVQAYLRASGTVVADAAEIYAHLGWSGLTVAVSDISGVTNVMVGRSESGGIEWVNAFTGLAPVAEIDVTGALKMIAGQTLVAIVADYEGHLAVRCSWPLASLGPEGTDRFLERTVYWADSIRMNHARK